MLRKFFRRKMTIMFIPHSYQAVKNIILYYWVFYAVVIGFFFLFFTSLFLIPSIHKKIQKYNLFKKSSSEFQAKMKNTHSFIPSIINSQKELSLSLESILNNMDINKIRINNKITNILPSDIGSHSTYFLYHLKNNINDVGSYIRSFQKYFRTTPSILPVRDHFYISSPFGWRIHPIKKHLFFHMGADLALMPGSIVRATADGYIATAEWHGGYGNAVFINHKNGYSTRYGHLMRIVPGLHKGSFVRRGQTIGYVGMTGVATGYHLHYEVRMNGSPLTPNRFFYLDRFR